MRRSIYIVAIVALCVSSYVYYNFTLTKCPEDYQNDQVGLEDRDAATNKWLAGFRKKNPDASLVDVARARYKFYIENECAATLQKYYEMEASDTETEEAKIMRETIQEEIRNQEMQNLIEGLNQNQQNDKSKQ